MSTEPADWWLDYVDLDWLEDDDSIDALLRDVSALVAVEEPSSDEHAV